jgi:hypothetical protein
VHAVFAGMENPVNLWTVQDVVDFLGKNNLEAHAQNFIGKY